MESKTEQARRTQRGLGYTSIGAGGIAIALVAQWEQSGAWNAVAAGLSSSALLIWFQDKTSSTVRTTVAQIGTGCWAAAAASFLNSLATLPQEAGMMAASAQIALLAALWMAKSRKPRT